MLRMRYRAGSAAKYDIEERIPEECQAFKRRTTIAAGFTML